MLEWLGLAFARHAASWCTDAYTAATMGIERWLARNWHPTVVASAPVVAIFAMLES